MSKSLYLSTYTVSGKNLNTYTDLFRKLKSEDSNKGVFNDTWPSNFGYLDVQLLLCRDTNTSGAFLKLQKATIIFVVSVCPSVSPYIRMEQLGSHLTAFHET
jgi:hypothetical protein